MRKNGRLLPNRSGGIYRSRINAFWRFSNSFKTDLQRRALKKFITSIRKCMRTYSFL